ncbi:2-hydroxychromene-2-carboxylate isomerase [Prosthecodimorpha staleyi]|uniref:2-hydroxychromene-2-carboxylate isomerase n=1 Tax=Prosthecodimorpha staleyi TaxID=2840188 RepID=A0A947GDF4_9HYPH|nr:2-hydroxychromene-2-carboxylate isomerase [Prosthecodimorpha staleyi]MBT9290792.1 2-hydroxychromene-2-carboxylate isomerase [Prosthecodimorpha staleyi]
MVATPKPVSSVEFWYEFASTYSYLSAMRIEAAAAEAGVAITWRPFLLGPIFAGQGWTTSPFNLYPAKGRYMWRDMERSAAAAGLPFRRPDPFPQNTLLAARLALIGAQEGWVAPFSRAVYTAEFGEGRDVSKAETLVPLLDGLGLAGQQLVARARADEAIKNRLKIVTEDAQRHGIFGAPSFVTADGELFWGNDRLDEALAWAAGTHDGASARR